MRSVSSWATLNIDGLEDFDADNVSDYAATLEYYDQIMQLYNDTNTIYWEGHDKVIGGVGIADDEERRRPSVPQPVKLHLVIGHNLPELWDVKGGQSRATANKYAAGRLA